MVSLSCSACLLSNGEVFVCKSRRCFLISFCNRWSMPVCLDAPRGMSKTAWVCLSLLLLHAEISLAHSKSLHLHCNVVVVIVSVAVVVIVVVVVIPFIMMMQQSHAS